MLRYAYIASLVDTVRPQSCVFRSSKCGDWNSISTVSPVGALYQGCIYSYIAPEDGRKHPPKHVELV
jgi:hypothetical protein